MDRFFAEPVPFETKLWQGLLYTFFGLGVLATMAAIVRWFWPRHDKRPYCGERLFVCSINTSVNPNLRNRLHCLSSALSILFPGQFASCVSPVLLVLHVYYPHSHCFICCHCTMPCRVRMTLICSFSDPPEYSNREKVEKNPIVA